MSRVLVLVTSRAGEVTAQSLRVLDQARTWGDVAACWLGSERDEASVTEVLARHGADLVLRANILDGSARPATQPSSAGPNEHDSVPVASIGRTPTYEVVAAVLDAAIERTRPAVVALPASDLATEVAATLAARHLLPVAVDITSAEWLPDQGLRFHRHALAGAWDITGELFGAPLNEARTLGIVTVLDGGPHPIEARASELVRMAAVLEFDPGTLPGRVTELSSDTRLSGVEERSDEPAADTRVLRNEATSTPRARLADAAVVVVAGRGVGGNLGAAEDLAAQLGGVVGGSRAAVDARWLDRSAQVGLTGAKISPELYVGLGVSGAVHHLAGISGARLVVAVNSDPEAPIFRRADFGVVGDVATVVPQALAALSEDTELSGADSNTEQVGPLGPRADSHSAAGPETPGQGS